MGRGSLRGLLEHHGLSCGPEPVSEGVVPGLAGGLGLPTARLPSSAAVSARGDLKQALCRKPRAALPPCPDRRGRDGWLLLRDRLEAAGLAFAAIAELKLQAQAVRDGPVASCARLDPQRVMLSFRRRLDGARRGGWVRMAGAAAACAPEAAM
jgi:hypothetical protein